MKGILANSVDPDQMLLNAASDQGLPMKGILANSVDPDQMPLNAATDQGLHCLH